MTIALIALGGAQAYGAEVRWGEDTRKGPVVWLSTAAGEQVDLTVRAEGGTHLNPEEIVVENAAGTLTTSGTFPPKGSCEPEEVECRAPCRIKTPQRARCSIYDGFIRRPKPLNPYESPYRAFRWGVELFLSDADDRVTVPTDNAVRFRLLPDTNGGADTYDLSQVESGFWAGAGDVVTSGPGANVGVLFWGPGTFDSVNDRADQVDCEFLDGPYDMTIRADRYDETGDCTGDIQRVPEGVGPVPAPPDLEAQLIDASDVVAGARRCIESNVASPGSCTTP